MLSRVLKEKIQKKYGAKIKYPKDCYGLAEHIKSECKCVVSASTLKRAFGFTQGTEYLRPATKDALAAYLGMDDWNKLQDDLLGRKVSRKPIIEQLQSSELKQGQVVLVMFGKVSFIKIQHCGEGMYKVIDQCKSKVETGDEVFFSQIKLDYPLLVSMKKAGARMRDVILGELTGVTEIELLHKVKLDERLKLNSHAAKNNQ
jgi:hypothetical protein